MKKCVGVSYQYCKRGSKNTAKTEIPPVNATTVQNVTLSQKHDKEI